MKVKASKISTDVIRIFVNEQPLSIKEGTITLYLYLSRNDQEETLSAPYSKDRVVYDFNFGKKHPRNIGDLKYSVGVKDGDVEEKTRRVSIFGGLPHHLNGLKKKIESDFRIVARGYNGSRAWFFKKLPGEEQCNECWDKDLGGSNNSSCKVCGGTGRMRYFARPYKTICGPIVWSDEKFVVDDPGKELQSTLVKITSVADLLLVTDDILYYESTGEFYRVTSRTVSAVQSTPVLQTMISSLLPSDYSDARLCRKLLDEETR